MRIWRERGQLPLVLLNELSDDIGRLCSVDRNCAEMPIGLPIWLMLCDVHVLCRATHLPTGRQQRNCRLLTLTAQKLSEDMLRN